MRCIKLLLLLIICVAGCASHADRAAVIRSAYYAGDLQTALARTDPAETKKDHDADVVKLNRAMIELSNGSPDQAEQLLRQVRDRFTHLEQKTVVEQAHAMARDDRKLAYSGEGYEKILIRVMLALSNLMRDGGDVHAYVLQIVEEQQKLLAASREHQPTNHVPDLARSEHAAEPPLPPEYLAMTKQLVLGSYLRAAVLESSPLDYDDVQRSRVQVAKWQPDFRDAKIDLARAESGRHSAVGNGVVYVVAMVGQGPYKREVTAEATTVSLLIADRIISAIGKYELPPNIAPVRIPEVVRARQTVDSIQVMANGQPVGSTATIMDVSELAVQQNRWNRDDVIARAVARRVVKKGAIYAAKEGLNVERSPELDLLLTIAGVAWEATEKADTRCWSLLPDRIQVLRIELPAGSHHLSVAPRLYGGRNGLAESTAVEVRDGQTTFVMATFPDDKLVGKILQR